MANIYLRSTGGSDADNGSTWALAKATLAGADTIEAAGDTIFVASDHTEANLATVSYSFAGTIGNPTKVICSNFAAEPPTGVAVGAVVSTGSGGNYVINITGNCYQYGIAYKSGVGGVSSGANINIGLGDNSLQIYEQCTFECGSNANTLFVIGVPASSTETRVDFLACGVKFANSGQGIRLSQAKFRWLGGELLAGTVTPASLIRSAGPAGGVHAEIIGVDLSAAGSGMHLIEGGAVQIGQVLFSGVKLPTGWSGNLLASAPATPAFQALLLNSGNDTLKIRYWGQSIAGTVRDNETVHANATDGVAEYSLKMDSSASTSFAHLELETPPMEIWNDTVGSALTVSAEILHDSLTALTNADAYLRVVFYDETTSQHREVLFNRKASVLASAANHAAGALTWTHAMTNPNKQKLSVTFTPQQRGRIVATVVLIKPSTTVYVNPVLEVA